MKKIVASAAKSVLHKTLQATRGLLDIVESKIEEPGGILPELPIEPQPLEPGHSSEETSPAVPLSTFEDRKPMNVLLRKWARVSGRTIKELRKELRSYVKVTIISDMSKAQVNEACVWIEKNIAAGSIADANVAILTPLKNKPQKNTQGSLLQ